MSLLAIERQAKKARARRDAHVEPTGLKVTIRSHDDEVVLAARHDEARSIRLALAAEEVALAEA